MTAIVAITSTKPTTTMTTTTATTTTNTISTTIGSTAFTVCQTNNTIPNTNSDIAPTLSSSTVSSVDDDDDDANMHTLLKTVGSILSPMVPHIMIAQVSQPLAADEPSRQLQIAKIKLIYSSKQLSLSFTAIKFAMIGLSL